MNKLEQLKAKQAELRAKYNKTSTAPTAAPAPASKHPTTTIPPSDLLAKYRAQTAIPLETPAIPVPELAEVVPISATSGDRVEKHAITYDDLNNEQRQAVDWAIEGNSFCLVGSAGTGKSTTQRIVLQQLQESGVVRPMQNFQHKYLPANANSIAIVSFVNKAVENIRALLPDEFKPNACTIHKLIEFAPEYEEREYIDENTGEPSTKNVLVFRPQRHQFNPIVGLTHIIVEEATTISEELFQLLLNALPNQGAGICFIFLGDLKQLPPVFGLPILARKMRELPYIELTRIYRQALESPIKKLAIAINEGNPISDEELRKEYEDKEQLRLVNLSGLHPKTGKHIKRRDGDIQIIPLINHFKAMLLEDEFRPFRDIILCPHRVNKRDDINCDYINQNLAEAAGVARDAEVFEVLAGRTKKYLAVGDPVLYAKEEYLITDIRSNPSYQGIPAKLSSTTMDRWGTYREEGGVAELDLDISNENTEAILNMNITTQFDEEDEEVKRAASHIITLEYQTLDPDAQRTVELNAAGEVADIDFAYALTVHKAIGSEWDSVYFLAHHSHMRMLTRELVYTAITRAKNHLTIYYDGQNHNAKELHSSTLNKAIRSPAIKGTSIEEKLAWLEAKEAQANEDTSNLLEKYKRS